MTKTVEEARNEFLDWFDFFILTGGDLQVARLFIDSSIEYDKLQAKEEEQELE